MNAKFHPIDPENISFSMTVTLTLAQWRKLHANIDRGAEPDNPYPGLDLQVAIADMVRQAERVYYPTPEISP